MPNHTFLIRTNRGPWPSKGLPAFVLEQDPWNDYGFRTQYVLSYVTKDLSGRRSENFLGPVKILKRGQIADFKPQLSDPFSSLGEDFCSVGESLDYYERIRALPILLRDKLLKGLRDVVDTPEIANDFRGEKGWDASLFRYNQADNHLRLARGLLTGDFTKLPGKHLKFTFTLPSWLKPVSFDFSSPSFGAGRRVALPERVAVLVGRNGSGKSTLIARLARVALATLAERESTSIELLGTLTPKGIGFPRVVSITFSPFDSFRLPGLGSRERKKRKQELELGEGRFAFIGLRDLVAERTILSDVATGLDPDRSSDDDRLLTTKLKSIDQLAAEFVASLAKIREKNRAVDLNDVFSDLLSGSAFDEHLDTGLMRCTTKEASTAFLRCSTGHKIVALTIVGLVAALEPLSLVLIDEPETHLHPPLLASLMHAIRAVLKKYESFCIVATHSPVVVQESLARHVMVVRRQGTQTQVFSPATETFGESIGAISSDVFGLDVEATDYRSTLDRLWQKVPNQEELEALFLNDQMSMQARAYVLGERLRAEADDI